MKSWLAKQPAGRQRWLGRLGVVAVVAVPSLYHGWIAHEWLAATNYIQGTDALPLMREEGAVYRHLRAMLTEGVPLAERLNHLQWVWRSEKWPHLTFVLTALWSLVTERSYTAIHQPFIGHLALLLGGIFAIGSRLGGRVCGAICTLTAASFPYVYGIPRTYSLDLPLMAMVCWGIYLLLRTESLTQRRWVVAFGVWGGLGLLTKSPSYLIFMGLPTAWLCLEIWREGVLTQEPGPRLQRLWGGLKARRREVKHLALATGLGILVLAPWWATSWDLALDFFRNVWLFFTNPEALDPEEIPISNLQRDSLSFWNFYLRVIWIFLLPEWALLAVPALGWFLLRGPGRDRDRRLVFAWFAINFCFFTYINEHVARYIFPALTPLAIGLGCFVATVQGRVRQLVRLGWVGLVVFHMLFSYSGVEDEVFGRDGFNKGFTSPWRQQKLFDRSPDMKQWSVPWSRPFLRFRSTAVDLKNRSFPIVQAGPRPCRVGVTPTHIEDEHPIWGMHMRTWSQIHALPCDVVPNWLMDYGIFAHLDYAYVEGPPLGPLGQYPRRDGQELPDAPALRRALEHMTFVDCVAIHPEDNFVYFLRSKRFGRLDPRLIPPGSGMTCRREAIREALPAPSSGGQPGESEL